MWPFRRKQPEQRALWQVGDTLPVSSSFADTRVTADTALRLSAVWGCVRLLADTVSTLPVDVYRRGERDPLAPPPLLANPAAGWSLPDWLYATMVSLLLRGNAYALITARSGPAMRPAQVELVHPDLMAVTVLLDGTVEYRYKGSVVDRDDLWHARAFVYPGCPTGLSPVAYAAESLGLGLATQRFGKQYFEEGALPSGLLTTEQNLSQDNANMLKQMFKARTRGSREPVVLGHGTTYQAISVSPEESQFIESRKLTVADVCRVFGVPPEMVASEAGGSLTYANVEGRALDFLKFSVNPWLVRLEHAIGLLLPRGQQVKFNAGALLRTTTTERYAAHKVGLDAGFLTLDEVRQLEDRPPLDAPVTGGIA